MSVVYFHYQVQFFLLRFVFEGNLGCNQVQAKILINETLLLPCQLLCNIVQLASPVIL